MHVKERCISNLNLFCRFQHRPYHPFITNSYVLSSPFRLKVLVQAFLYLLEVCIHSRHPLHHVRVAAASSNRIWVVEYVLHQEAEVSVYLDSGGQPAHQ